MRSAGATLGTKTFGPNLIEEIAESVEINLLFGLKLKFSISKLSAPKLKFATY